ncbi:hypothetical protein BRARA_E01009 [Brassica rapa]|uniref:Uncharacterized protein n=1 Tax=Brassica campestris TaxID=3711 RepID=A0A397Z8V8_BRACM|nr:hypothetical protein BRARA_E01009 [Brassica rapa]
MGGVEDNHWVDLMIDKIGFALTKVDESIQKSIELWKELTKDIYDEQPTHDTTGQPNDVKSGEEDSSQDKCVAEVKERPIQHWAMRLGEAKESPSQHWDMCASKISESLIQEQGDDEVDEKEKEDDEGTVSESSGEEDMCELTLGNSVSSDRPNLHHHHNEEASTRGNHHMSTNDDTSSKQDDESCEEDEEEDEDEEEEEETNLETLETSYRHSPSGYQHRNEEDTKYRFMSDATNISHDDDDIDDDDLSDKLQGFVDVKEEEIENKTECGEVETLSTECDWVFVTRD